MKRIRTEHDIKPVSEFRANTAEFLQRVQEEKRPLVLTQRGHSAAVLLAATEYDRLLSELALLRDIARAEREIDEGKGVPHDEALARLLGGIER